MHYSSKMSIYNTLRALPSRVADMLQTQGFLKDLTPEERSRMEENLNALTEEWFGASAVEEKEKKKEKKTKTKAAVVSTTPAVMDRAHLETLTVSELKELGKDCAAIKGRKPRAELIELVLQHLSGSSTVSPEPVASPVASGAAEESSEGSDEELREEPPPTEDKSKKAKPVKEKKEKAPKEKKEKAKPAKKEKKEKEKEKEKEKAEESPAEESDDENTVELKEWFHPSEMHKPKEERQRYFIDQKTNELFHPDRLQDGEAEWRWDEDSGEIVPIS
jgi:hypothetical protein